LACAAGNAGVARRLAGELNEATAATSAAVSAWLDQKIMARAA
jgi:hypothetical protein